MRVDRFKKNKKNYHTLIWSLLTLVTVLVSHLHLQLSQNNYSFELVFKFATSWHTEKFLLGTCVLLLIDIIFITVSGSYFWGNLLYLISTTILAIVNYYKMSLRIEPVYPEDFKMLTEFKMFKDIMGLAYMVIFLLVVVFVISLLVYSIYQSRKLSWNKQIARISMFVLSGIALFYIGHFNQPGNLLKKAYTRTAKWIPYSQKMNYYNVGFVGGFLYNLPVDPMDEPKDYSKEEIEKIVKKYNKVASEKNKSKKLTEQPNVIYVMSESFSNSNQLKGVEVKPDPLKDYWDVANKSQIKGQMLSQGYGGGTANIEFEALTGFSMERFNPQLSTPYTMLLPKKKKFPSLVSQLAEQGYYSTAIHPYNTSMYKRNQVYDVLGFDKFLSEDTMKYQDALSDGGFISDESAFNEVLDILDNPKKPQFVHLVTMQTHMPYNLKYAETDYAVNLNENEASLVNYAQDLAYTSDALKQFTNELGKLERPSILVFWGDHLPSIYPDSILKQNSQQTMHLTEYFVLATTGLQKQQVPIVSPVYFPALVSEQEGVKTTGFNELLQTLRPILPAFEKESYYINKNWSSKMKLSSHDEEIFREYALIQYDMVSGEKYSQALFE